MYMIKKKVAVIGCGGLGGYVIEELARLGIEHLVLVDGDTFSTTNLNRQLLATSSTINKSKVEAYASKISKINEDIKVEIYNDFLNSKNTNIIDGCDLVIDCLDNIEARLVLAKACSKKNIPLVHGSIGNDEGEVALIMPKSNMMERIYKDAQEMKVATTSFAVATIASYQTALAYKYLTCDYMHLLDKLILIDLSDFTVKKIMI